jgi:hypothetical protein
LTGYGQGWDAALFDIGGSPTVALGVKNGSIITPGTWIEDKGLLMMALVVCPPEFCRAEQVHVHVCKRSTGEEAIVEFGFDPAAAGPGCYVVS